MEKYHRTILRITLTFLLISFGGVLLALAQSEYRHSLNGEWSFKTDLYNQGEKENWYQSEVDLAGWDEMEVPGNWDVKNEYADYVGKAWYTHDFNVNESWENKNVRIYFESVYNDAQLWINGKKVGEHHVGFLPFWFDINSYLKFGERNRITLQVDNTFKRGAIWNWGGIRRPVWLEVTEPVRLEYQHITAMPDLEQGTAEVSIKAKISNLSEQAQTVNLLASVLKDGRQIWKGDALTVSLSPDSEEEVNMSFSMTEEQLQLWHFNHPELYFCQLILQQDNKSIHRLTDRFGVRKIEVKGETLLLNGEAIRSVGFNLVPEDRTTGNALPLWRIRQDVDMMKSLGANMARLSHLPLPKDFLDYLDEKGIMTFEEVSLWGKDEMVDPEHPLPQYWLDKMVEVKYNHPSVIGWSIGNEIGFVDRNPKVMEYVEGAIQRAKALDPTRLAIYVSHSASAQEDDPVKYADMIMFNSYGAWGARAEKVNQLHPGKPIFMAEYGHNLNDENLNEAHIEAAEMLDEFRGKEYMAGVSLWTFNDYRSFWKANESWTTPPSQNRTWGVVDVFRQKKRPHYAFKREYAPVKDMTVKMNGNEVTVSIMPRNRLDIPAYTLRDYTLVWKLVQKSGEVVEGGIIGLPEIKPDGSLLHRGFSWEEGDQSAFGLRVELLDPQSYSVRDTTIYFAAPETPEIRIVHTADEEARVVFTPVEGASGYKIVYGKDGLDQESPLTINDYMDIQNLDKLARYQFAVVAVNNAGESEASTAVQAQLDEDELPPIIRATIPFDDHFFIGYSVDRLDYMYEIEYGTEPGEYSQRIGLRNVGVCQLPNLVPGETYYYRMRSRKQWGFASEWTHEVEVKLKGGEEKESIALQGVLRDADQAVLVFEPEDRAVGYLVSYREKNKRDWSTKALNASQIRHILIPELKKNKAYTFTLEALFEQQPLTQDTDALGK
ncbi:beta-galactosidase [Catalinimonas alkaloidigena]|uniref:glycoside hydrolase family 2 TIM barrel-domain containing protein n=1 Tax=Catalinimonas alkaloidigena TaxID=1075417 RepID=UPI002407422F|nr:glycoside hydrolase family 2 TIM barrel-domain containing protein [Catalinimonas alkaloidigena]MDF9795436.1 beta-galactosidase [Catalinimonas alkaloidigena]